MASMRIIARYLALFHELYPTRDITSHTADAWEYACRDMSDADFRASAERVLREPGRTYFPTPNELQIAPHRAIAGPRQSTGVAAEISDAVEEWYRTGGPRRWMARRSAQTHQRQSLTPLPADSGPVKSRITPDP